LNLKLRLNLIITSLLLLIMLAGVLLSFNNARKNALAEISSAEKSTLYLFDTASFNRNHSNLKEFDYHAFKLNRLAHMRHLKIELIDNAGNVLDTNQAVVGRKFHNEAPAWVESVFNRISPVWQPSIRPVEFQGKALGKLVITPDPTYEYAEIWKQMTDLFILLSVFFVCVNLIISWAIAQALKPTEKILSALDEIEKGNLEARLPEFQLPELARIGQKFNRMIGTLQKSIFQNHKLTQQFITLQEEERKSLARDLHDEFGQCLTAINTDASVILKHAKDKYPELYASAFAITDLSRHLMDLVSGLLQKLRPGVLNELGLAVALHDLVDTWQFRNENTLCTLTMNDIESALGEAESLTLYRLVQECLTNISRHANASVVKIDVHTEIKVGKSVLQVSIHDNGKGFDPSIRTNGLGLPGMRERVEGLNGELAITSQLNQGTSVSAWIPLSTNR
jgi:two-component system sensor histidine kinase UhpB